MSYDRAREFLSSLGLPGADPGELPDSPHRFPDGAQYRIEIPSVEGPEAMAAVLDEAAGRGVRIHRVSQGSGVMLQTDEELAAMAKQGTDKDVEVVLWSGLRAGWGTGAQPRASSGALAGAAQAGTATVVAAVDEALRAVEAGIDGVLVADLGLLAVLGELRRRGDLPASFVLKVSVSLPVANPATARTLVDLGATTLNLPVDLPLAVIAGIRAAVAVPLDLYVEGPDDFGAPLRYHELPDLVRVAAPVHLKFTARNAPGIYPAGAHLREAVLATARERVRRAAIGRHTLVRHAPRAAASP